VLLGALLAHVSVNTLNEYLDFKSGLDLNTSKTPFSGGSGTQPENPAALTAVLTTELASLAGTAAIGLFFVLQSGTGIIPIGLCGLLIIASYTDWINRHPIICLIAQGVGFGFLMVLGTHVVLQGSHSTTPIIVAAVPFFLANNLLLLN
jgi:1,4-dihydroxy-2-naphthoate octaprenyltransferase